MMKLDFHDSGLCWISWDIVVLNGIFMGIYWFATKQLRILQGLSRDIRYNHQQWGLSDLTIKHWDDA